MRARGWAAVSGAATGAVGVGVAELVAVLTGARSAPLTAVGGVVVDAVPEPLERFAIDVFGRNDKAALLVGTVVLLAAFAALIGLAALQNRWYGFAGIALFAAIGIAAALTRPDATVGYALPTLLGAVAAAGTLHVLLPATSQRRRRVPRAVGPEEAVGPGAAVEASRPPWPTGRDRRWLLMASVGGVVAAVGGRLLSTRRGIAAARDTLVLPPPSEPAGPVPSGAELGVPGLASYLTSNRDFYRIDTALTVPQVDPDTWRLRVHGRVRNPIELTFEQLLARPMVERHVTLACVSNEVGGDLIGNARWLGVPVRDLLDEAGQVDGADQVVSRSADGWTCGTPTAVLRDGRDALLAVGMNGEPLPVAHGFPVRMVTPGLYGYVSACKWLVELELTSFADYDAYWVRRGWAQQAPIKTQSRIDVPRRGRELPAGTVTVAGVAWAQHVGIAKVEVSVDGGQWREATLADTVSPDTWRQWSWVWPATPGRHQLRVRATDANGRTQPEQETAPFPDGATGWHTINVTVR